jgi:hypothetical protein
MTASMLLSTAQPRSRYGRPISKIPMIDLAGASSNNDLEAELASQLELKGTESRTLSGDEGAADGVQLEGEEDEEPIKAQAHSAVISIIPPIRDIAPSQATPGPGLSAIMASRVHRTLANMGRRNYLVTHQILEQLVEKVQYVCTSPVPENNVLGTS